MDRRNINEIKTNAFRWINVSHLGRAEAEYLRKNFGFESLDLEMCLPPLERPNFYARKNYQFLILLFPYYDRKAHTIKSAEVGFFIAKNTLTTVSMGELIPFNNLWNRTRAAGLGSYSGLGELLYKIIGELVKECFPMLAHISHDIDEIEQKLFKASEKGTIGEILRIKTNIVNFQKTIQSHKAVLRKLLRHGGESLDVKELEIYFNYLIEETKEVWDALDSYKSTIDALHEANDSLISYRTSDIMRTLTFFSAIVFVMSFVVTLFSANFFDNPLVDNPYGFRIVLGLSALAVAGLIVFFKKKKWF